MQRSVETVPGFEDAVDSQIRMLDATCAAGVLFLVDELEAADPDLDERCGLLDMRHEVYSLRIPGCRRHRLAVSIDRRARDACAVHGVVSASDRECAAAHQLAAAQLKLIGKPWEPAR